MTITVAPHPGRVRVRFNGQTVVDTTRALALQEGGYKPVLYLPRADADMTLFARTAQTTRCPHKGQASYYSLKVGDRTAVNAVWTYETPHDQVAAIREHLAFYPDRVDAIEDEAAA
ncbi:MAG: DUF427 domain-containing protein [Geminicoccaceae bacterium]